MMTQATEQAQAVLYARQEPSDDPWLTSQVWDNQSRLELAKKRDVQLYYDEAATDPASRYPWYYDSKPDHRNKWINHNCARYRLVWLPDLEPRAAAI